MFVPTYDEVRPWAVMGAEKGKRIYKWGTGARYMATLSHIHDGTLPHSPYSTVSKAQPCSRPSLSLVLHPSVNLFMAGQALALFLSVVGSNLRLSPYDSA